MAVEVTTEVVIDRAVELVARFAMNPDNAPRWYPATPEEVTEEMLDAIFAPLPPGEEWTPYPA